MKVEYNGPFVESAIRVMQSLIGSAPERGALGVRSVNSTQHQVNVLIGVKGDILGRVIIGMPVKTADRLASLVLGISVVTFDQAAATALADITKEICRTSVQQIVGAGYFCETTPPSVIRGSNVRISNHDCAALIVPIKLADFGEIEICLCLTEAQDRAA